MLKIQEKSKLGLIFGLFVSTVLMACQPSDTPTPAPEQVDRAAPKTIYLVRHAEKQKGDDPDLTAAGWERAEELSTILSDKGLTRIYSSDYRRTKQTAEPIAAATGLPVYDYDARDLPALALRLKAECGVCLVVGHSNTTPDLAALLGGDPGTPIDEASEYDRLYVIVMNYPSSDNGQNEPQVRSEILRYGTLYAE